MLRRGLLHGSSLGGAKSESVVWEFHLQNMRNHKALYKEWSTRSSEAAKMDPCVRDYLRASVRYNCHTVSRINGVAKEAQIGDHIAAYCYKLQNQKQMYFYKKKHQKYSPVYRGPNGDPNRGVREGPRRWLYRSIVYVSLF